ELALALFHQRHQRADPGGLQRLDHDLVFRRARIGRELAGGDDLEALLRPEPHPAMDALPDHRLDLGALVLEREITVPGGVRSPETGDFAAHPDRPRLLILGSLIALGLILSLTGAAALLLTALVAAPLTKPPPLASISDTARAVDRSTMPDLQRFQARDGTGLVYRRYPARGA